MKSGRVVHRCIRSACRSRRCVGLCSVVVAVFADTANAVLVALKVHPATIAGNPKARGKTTARAAGAKRLGSTMGNMMRTRRLHARLAYVRRLHERLFYVVGVDDCVSVAHVAVTPAV